MVLQQTSCRKYWHGDQESGSSLLELLIGLGITSIIFAVFSSLLLNTIGRSHDQRVMSEVNIAARTTMEQMLYEIRMTGSGVPLGQEDFSIQNAALGDSPLAVLPDSNASSLTFRANEEGKVSILSADFTPSSSSLTLSVLSTDGLTDGDTVYLSNLTAGGTSGLHGRISGMSSNSITLESDYTAPAGATFPAGSSIERVELITYAQNSSGKGIDRISSEGTITVLPNATMSITYIGSSGATLSLPLSDSVIANQLQAVDIHINVSGSIALKNGTYYSTSITQRAALRNLFFNR